MQPTTFRDALIGKVRWRSKAATPPALETSQSGKKTMRCRKQSLGRAKRPPLLPIKMRNFVAYILWRHRVAAQHYVLLSTIVCIGTYSAKYTRPKWRRCPSILVARRGQTRQLYGMDGLCIGGQSPNVDIPTSNAFLVADIDTSLLESLI
jgi:hypothetical protein